MTIQPSDIETNNHREKMLKLREELRVVEEYRMRGDKGFTVDEVDVMLSSVINEVENAETIK